MAAVDGLSGACDRLITTLYEPEGELCLLLLVSDSLGLTILSFWSNKEE